jgi:hypothetical protein
MTTNARDRVAAGERVLSLSEAADLLHMKRSNTGKFLRRRGVEPAFPKAQGYFYWAADIERVKAEREANEERMAADARRRESALNRTRGEVNTGPPPPEVERLGPAQRAVLSELVRKPLPVTGENRFTIHRLRQRGLVDYVPGATPRTAQLTAEGGRLAGWL